MDGQALTEARLRSAHPHTALPVGRLPPAAHFDLQGPGARPKPVALTAR